jgi:radical SAM protein with 4Fe4S-binding SPASM domain
MAVTARGGFMPCPHMFNEQFNDSVMDYWLNDEKLNQFRENNVTKKDKCSNCLYDETCRPCNVVSESLESCVCFEKL